jgi:uncharacterized protein (TIGR02466 family)
MQILRLFPTIIGSLDLDSGLSDKEKKILLSFGTRPNLMNRTTENSYVLDHADLKRLKEFFTKSINDYLKNIIDPISECSLYVTQSWVNHSKKGEGHHLHRHPNSILSGVFYITADSDRDKIYFYKKDKPDIKIHSKNYTDLNSDSWWIPAKENLLLIFPSAIEHNVNIITEGNTVRSSLSFNTFVKGTIGLNTNLDELILN